MSETDKDWLTAQFYALHKRIYDTFGAQDKRIDDNVGALHSRIDDKAQAHENSINAHVKHLEQRITDAAKSTNRTLIFVGLGLSALALFLRYFG